MCHWMVLRYHHSTDLHCRCSILKLYWKIFHSYQRWNRYHTICVWSRDNPWWSSKSRKRMSWKTAKYLVLSTCYSLASSRLFIFVCALSQFSGPDSLGAWNRLVTPFTWENSHRLEFHTGMTLLSYRVYLMAGSFCMIKCRCVSKSQTLRMRYPFQSTGRPISWYRCEMTRGGMTFWWEGTGHPLSSENEYHRIQKRIFEYSMLKGCQV